MKYREAIIRLHERVLVARKDAIISRTTHAADKEAEAISAGEAVAYFQVLEMMRQLFDMPNPEAFNPLKGREEMR